ncbi:putative serine/threonine-protein kinase [Hordeum vulgare]|nr:putative serine/threonine-protein kinase [Hordeum vulgare]
MDNDLDVASGLASLASSDITTTPSRKGKPRNPRKIVIAPKKKELTPEEQDTESEARGGRKGRSSGHSRHRGEGGYRRRIAAEMREALLYLGLNPSQHGLVNTTVAVASTGSSAFPQMVLPESPHALATYPIPGFHVYPQASRLFGEFSPEGDAAAAGGDAVASYNPEETQRQDGRGSFTLSTYDQARMKAVFMQDQVGLNLDGFPLEHMFPDDYGLEEEDEAFKVQHKGKSFHLSHCWRIIKDEEQFKAQYAVEEVGEGEKPRLRGKTNSKKEDK